MECLATIILDALTAKMYLAVRLKTVRDLDLSLKLIQRMMRTTFINQSERLSLTKNNSESKRYQELNRRGRENGRESAMSTAFINCHYCGKPGHKVRDCENLEREHEMEKWKNSIMREKKIGVVTIKQTAIPISSVTSKWESRKNSKWKA